MQPIPGYCTRAEQFTLYITTQKLVEYIEEKYILMLKITNSDWVR